jgi:plasmid stability protein
MASLTIRRLDEATKARLRVPVAQPGRSMEAEARGILKCALARQKSSPQNLADALHAKFAPLGGLELPEYPRQPLRDPPQTQIE